MTKMTSNGDARHSGARPTTLEIDRVASSQPELGPSIPDGGYGWVIVLATTFFQCLIPSLISGFGILLLFSKLEHSTFSYPMLWDDQMVHTPLLFIAFWAIAEPWSRKLIASSTWPRLVGIAGTSVTCAGLLFMWIAVNGTARLALFVLAGIFTGIGASMLTAQTEILLAQYFRLKLPIVNDILEAAVAVGFIVTPIVLGNSIIEHGLLRILLWYQTLMLQGIIISLLLKKPKYLKSVRRIYDYIPNSPDDEEDIFTKDVRELQTRREPTNSSVPAIVEESNEVNATPSTSNAIREEDHSESISPKNKWVKFADDNPNTIKHTLHESFAQDFNQDLDRIDKFEDNFIETPRPLFNDTQVNNNTTYSYDLIETDREIYEPTVFEPPPTQRRRSSLQQNIDYFKQPTFYKSLLTIVTTKFSEFTFFTLFPSYLYVRLDSLKVHHGTFLVGCIAISGLFFTLISIWVNARTKHRHVILWMFCWFGSCGYLLLSDTRHEVFFLLGATQVILCICTLQFIGGPLLGLTIRGETNQRHRNLSILSGLAFSIFLIIDFSYANCFRMMAGLQFLTGSVWLGNFIYKKWNE